MLRMIRILQAIQQLRFVLAMVNAKGKQIGGPAGTARL